jgi:hypothetical protein
MPDDASTKEFNDDGFSRDPIFRQLIRGNRRPLKRWDRSLPVAPPNADSAAADRLPVNRCQLLVLRCQAARCLVSANRVLHIDSNQPGVNVTEIAAAGFRFAKRSHECVENGTSDD